MKSIPASDCHLPGKLLALRPPRPHPLTATLELSWKVLIKVAGRRRPRRPTAQLQARKRAFICSTPAGDLVIAARAFALEKGPHTAARSELYRCVASGLVCLECVLKVAIIRCGSLACLRVKSDLEKGEKRDFGATKVEHNANLAVSLDNAALCVIRTRPNINKLINQRPHCLDASAKQLPLGSCVPS